MGADGWIKSITRGGGDEAGFGACSRQYAPSRSILQFTQACTHISSTDKLFSLQKAFGEITYLFFHKDAISVWGVMGATNLIV